MTSSTVAPGWQPLKTESALRSASIRTTNLVASSSPSSAPAIRTSPRFHHRQRSNSFSTAFSPNASLSPRSPAISGYSPVSAVHSATPEPQRAVERPASPHAARRRQTRDENAPYTFGSCGNGNPDRDGTADEIASLLEAGLGLGLGQESGGGELGEPNVEHRAEQSSACALSDPDFGDEDVEEGDDELSVEDEQDDDWTPPNPPRPNSSRNSPPKPNNSTNPSNSRPASSALAGLRSQVPREPDRHSHADRDAGAAGQALAAATRAVKSATTLVTQDKARANWIQLWSAAPPKNLYLSSLKWASD